MGNDLTMGFNRRKLEDQRRLRVLSGLSHDLVRRDRPPSEASKTAIVSLTSNSR
jgi:hypothetical protein